MVGPETLLEFLPSDNRSIVGTSILTRNPRLLISKFELAAGLSAAAVAAFSALAVALFEAVAAALGIPRRCLRRWRSPRCRSRRRRLRWRYRRRRQRLCRIRRQRRRPPRRRRCCSSLRFSFCAGVMDARSKCCFGNGGLEESTRADHGRKGSKPECVCHTSNSCCEMAGGGGAAALQMTVNKSVRPISPV
ncbi:uncharacterized protein [Miscanthus floridulus]|uniref:uncharacterized protein n=1 Tax=Miscanthus floridulus TaxID=154761 RepID=UPI0034588231